MRLSENMPSSEVEKPSSPGKAEAGEEETVNKEEITMENLGAEENLENLGVEDDLFEFSFSNEQHQVLRLRGGATEDSDSDETGKRDTEAEDDKEAEEARAEVGRVMVVNKSGNAVEIVELKAEKSSQEGKNLKKTLKSSLEQTEVMEQQQPCGEAKGGDETSMKRKSKKENLCSVPASFKLHCFNNSATCILPPILIEGEEFSEDQESDLEESEKHNKEKYDLKRRPGDWHHYAGGQSRSSEEKTTMSTSTDDRGDGKVVRFPNPLFKSGRDPVYGKAHYSTENIDHDRPTVGLPTGQEGDGQSECPPPLEDSDLDQPAGGWNSLSDEILHSQMETHKITLSDTGDDGSLKLKEQGALSKAHLVLRSLSHLKSSILLSDKIGLGLSQIDTDEDSSDQMEYDEGPLQYGDDETAIEEALDAELAKTEEKVDNDGDNGQDT